MPSGPRILPPTVRTAASGTSAAAAYASLSPAPLTIFRICCTVSGERRWNRNQAVVAASESSP
jgi:hypothetical protein